ncbi:NAD dependent epimerase/dehydratase [Lasiosphaeris hirsuta]|uniref:NAD dependent epimerase/dehydratase n=1 Tax=Lasiosphaeris hirsuta TaxID=260670 RepID=A0AA40A292_9PEZI|nr:NAD dependent epimerase/dehydratase [Lasiosphaeris hirsuta]
MATDSPPAVFVASATGTQGSAVARQLRDLGWQVHATTRNTDSEAAKDLIARGVRVTQGDWNNEAALEEAIAGCHLLFLCLFPNFTDPSIELAQAKAIFRIAKAARVTHAIYSGGLPTQTLPRYDPTSFIEPFRVSKQNIEKELKGAGFKYWTILEPAFFMANFLSPKVEWQYPGATETGSFNFAYRPDTVLPLIDHEDIAAFSVAAFREPDRFHQQTIRLAGELLTVGKIIELLAHTAERNLRGGYLSDEEVGKATDFKVTNQVLTFDLYTLVNLDEVRRWGLRLGTFEEFVEREAGNVKETYRNVKTSR